jgi:diguanylate cyclase (GGDEF)-like protein/PAS domain S-box-containing protein
VHLFSFFILVIFGASIINSLIKSNKEINAYKEACKTILNLSLDGIYIENERGDIMECNKAGHEMFYYTKEEMLKLNIRDLVPEDFRKDLPDIIPDEMATGDVYLERLNIKKNGDLFPTEINSKYVYLNNKKRLVVFVRDISERKKIDDKLRELSLIDELTKVYNRRCILNKLEDEIIKSRSENLPLSIALIDIDDFKKVNDSFGHLFGDEVLKKFSNIMAETIRKTDFMGRIGGEEFIIIFPNTLLEESNSILLRIKENLSFVSWEKENFSLTFSGGITELNSDNMNEFTSKDIINLTDQLMYKSKSCGKNCVMSSRTLPS